uniref:Dihydrolipoamide acetyltransferase component of pyruvate dehydrogenase complex n=1 Tax=Ciona savignyi TaxID=51511 RepID=H2YAV5_CIOSA
RKHFHTSGFQCEIVQFKLADIGEGIKEAEMIEWFVNEGDHITQFQDLCEVQSDKSTVKITSRYDGVIKKRYYELGEFAQVGQTLVDMEIEGEESNEADEEISTGWVIVALISAEQPIKCAEQPTPMEDVIDPPVPSQSSQSVLATPAVRNLAKQYGLNLSDIKGGGKDGRVLKEDIMQHAEQPHDVIPITTPALEDRVEPLKGIRKVCCACTLLVIFLSFKVVYFSVYIICVMSLTTIQSKAMLRSMKSSLNIPHFGYNDEYDLTELVLLRKRIKKEVKHSHGIKLSYMPFIVKAVSVALSKYPILNSQLDSNHENLIYKTNHNIGVAVDTPHGLLLPSVKSVQNMSVLDVANELNRLHEAGLNNKLSPSDIADGTFSLSNIGSIGGTYASPVIFPPQVAIGALGKIQVLPRFDRNGDLLKAHIMCISWSADHRVIEGATMARFSNLLKDFLENPSQLLLHLK